MEAFSFEEVFFNKNRVPFLAPYLSLFNFNYNVIAEFK